MLEHFHKFARFGFILCLMLLPLLTSEQGDAVDLDKLSESIVKGELLEENVFISEKSRSRFNKRMRDVVVDMVRLDYI